MDINEFQQDKEIDPSQLDVECVKQAELFFKWAERSIEAKEEADRAKLSLEVTEAKLQIQCRKCPEDFGLTKLTESVVTAAVKCHGHYQQKARHYLEARKNAALLEKAVMAMEQRKRMLEVLITLHGQQYFAGPSTPRDLVGAYQEHQKASSERLNARRKSKARRRGESRD